MLFKESLISAISSIRSNSIRSFLTSLAIIIGTAAVIAVIGIGSSAEKALEASIDDLGGRTLYVAPGQNRRGAVTKGLIPLDIKDARLLLNIKNMIGKYHQLLLEIGRSSLVMRILIKE